MTAEDPTAPQTGRRSVKRLACAARFTSHQREWFAAVQRRVADGSPFAVVNADTPHEIFRAFDIPYVVTQWWSAIIAAKQAAPRYLAALRERGYPDDQEQYNSLAFGEALAGDPATAPWGGLPKPTILHAAVGGDGLRKLFEEWAAHTGAVFYPIERSTDTRWRVSSRWWTELPSRWEGTVQAERLDLMVEELQGLIRFLEHTTGRPFPESRFRAILRRANEQAEYYRRTRDLVAGAVPAPVAIADTMPATMIPQWHRGSTWGLAAAREFHDEVAAAVRDGSAVCEDERVRLMWLGRGLWSDMAFYQDFEDRYGAVFVWSMYLALAADGYVRYFDPRETGADPGLVEADPLRALAARFVPMGEELRMPTWAAAWHLKEARLHRVDGVVSMGEDDYASTRRLEAAGIPVLRLAGSVVDGRTWDRAALRAAISRFIEERAEPVAARRRARS